MSSKPQYQLEEFSPEEGTLVSAAVDKVLAEHSAQLSVRAIINPNGTLGAVANVFKKVLVSSDTTKNEENNDTTGEEKVD